MKGSSSLYVTTLPGLVAIGIVVVEMTQPAITCLKLTIETLEQGVKYVRS